jgi:hypothetical protein
MVKYTDHILPTEHLQSSCSNEKFFLK